LLKNRLVCPIIIVLHIRTLQKGCLASSINEVWRNLFAGRLMYLLEDLVLYSSPDVQLS
jgi:hypothetical protein